MSRARRTSAQADPFLAVIDTRMAALQHLRDSYVAARAAGAIGPPAASDAAWLAPLAGPVEDAPSLAELTPQPAPGHGPAAPPRPGRRSSIASAAEDCLTGATEPRSVRQIATALRSQGVNSSGASLEATITSAMHRLRVRGRVVRLRDGWAAADSPAARHAASEPASARPAVSRPKRPRRPRPRPAPGEATPDRQVGGLAWRIESLLRSHGQPVAARYVANATGEPLNVVGLTLGRMIRQERVAKDPDGRFAVVVGRPRTGEEPDALAPPESAQPAGVSES